MCPKLKHLDFGRRYKNFYTRKLIFFQRINFEFTQIPYCLSYQANNVHRTVLKYIIDIWDRKSPTVYLGAIFLTQKYNTLPQMSATKLLPLVNINLKQLEVLFPSILANVRIFLKKLKILANPPREK